ncbi:hypothetical protein L9F63_014581, partial [Diploptera punctata]
IPSILAVHPILSVHPIAWFLWRGFPEALYMLRQLFVGHLLVRFASLIQMLILKLVFLLAASQTSPLVDKSGFVKRFHFHIPLLDVCRIEILWLPLCSLQNLIRWRLRLDSRAFTAGVNMKTLKKISGLLAVVFELEVPR